MVDQRLAYENIDLRNINSMAWNVQELEKKMLQCDFFEFWIKNDVFSCSEIITGICKKQKMN